jgi:putative ABC transport system permease protein
MAVDRRSTFEALLQDIRYASRISRRSPAFAIAAVVVLALGIGANTAVFSVVNAVLLKPLPYPEPERLVQLMVSSPTGNTSLVSIPQYSAWREGVFVFDGMAAFQAGGPGVNLSNGETSEHVNALHVSRDYFRVFGAETLLGRTFSRDEDRAGGANAVVISHALWQRRFGGARAILGRTILLGGHPHEVIGVISPRFRPDPAAELWLPLQADANSFDHTALLHVVARLRRHLQIDAARTQMARVAQPFRAKFPLALASHESFTAEPLQDVVVGDVRPALRLLMGAVAFVLIIACANAASLLLARAARRRVEIATRAALGARRSRLLRQLLTESTMLALAAGVLGLAIGHAGVRLFLSLATTEVPRIENAGAVPLDGVVLSFTLAISSLTGLLFGLAPSVSASRVDLSTAFKEGGAQSGTARQGRMQSWLVVAEMTLALVLLVGSGWMIRTFLAIRSVNLGFNAEQVIAIDTALTDEKYARTEVVARLIENVERRLEGMPGVAAMAVTRTLPLDPDYSLPFRIDRRTLYRAVPHHGTAGWHGVSPDYFRVLRIRVHTGRLFNEFDNLHSQPVAIINNAMVRRYWQNNPLGEKITIGSIAWLGEGGGADGVRSDRAGQRRDDEAAQ